MVIGPATFDKLCSASSCCAKHQLRTRERLERARLLLAAGTPVTETCMEVGFSSLGSFSGLFARWVGAPPSRYVAPPEVSCLELMTLSEKHTGPRAG